MSAGIKKAMVCVHCTMKICATIVQAKSHGWTVWVGGAACKGCSERIERQILRGGRKAGGR